jgi:hypothetical protein
VTETPTPVPKPQPKVVVKSRKPKKSETLAEVTKNVVETLKKDAIQEVTKPTPEIKPEVTLNIVFKWLGFRGTVKISPDETVQSWQKKLNQGSYSGLGHSPGGPGGCKLMILRPNQQEVRGLKEKILDHFAENDTVTINLRKSKHL